MPSPVELLRLKVLAKGIYLEMKGMKLSRGPSAYMIVKRELGLKGTRNSVYDQLLRLIDHEEGITK